MHIYKIETIIQKVSKKNKYVKKKDSKTVVEQQFLILLWRLMEIN